jgi:uncharacterized membrane protein
LKRSRYVAQAGVIAAVYAAATIVVLQLPAQLGWGLVQLRISEAITVIALFTPAAVPGLTLGSIAANSYLVTQVGLAVAVWDIVFGSLGTFLGALWMWRLRERQSLALAGPVVTNALIVPAYLPVVLAGLGLYKIPFLGIDVESAWLLAYLFGVVSIALGQAIVIYGLGIPLIALLKRAGVETLTPGNDA